MASKLAGKPVRSMWLGALLGITVAAWGIAAHGATAQEGPKPPRVRQLMQSAQDHYKRGDYEAAALLFAQAEERQSDLTSTEQRDLRGFVKQNTQALETQREGAVQLRRAQEALAQGKTQDAAKLLRAANANPYLSAQDKQALAKLNDDVRGPSNNSKSASRTMAKPMVTAPAKNDAKGLLAAARAALQRGELDVADAYAAEAEKANSGLASWFQAPWNDSPSKVRRDVQAARAKLMPVVAKESADKKDTGGLFGLKNLFKKDEKRPSEGPEQSKDPGVFAKNPPKSAHPKDAGPVAKNTQKSAQPGKTPEGPAVRQTTYPAKQSGDAATNLAQARKMIKAGYRALDNDDVETARKLALKAKDLRPNLEWWEDNPDRLLADVQRRSSTKPMTAQKPGVNPADARILVKEARSLLQENRLEEAEKLCQQAAGSTGIRWGLFEDTPDRLKNDIHKAKTKRDRDESARLLAEARKLHQMGNHHEARVKALRAQELHGPYSVWDLGDRPQKLLEEIQRAETKKGPADTPSMNVAKPKEQSKGQANQNPPALAKNAQKKSQPAAKAPPLFSGTAQAAVKPRAVALLNEARVLQRQGKLLEARAKAVEAKSFKVVFGPEEDSPESCLLSLSAQCDRHVQLMIKSATDHVMNHPTDNQRFHKAEADLGSARKLAHAFGQSTRHLDEKSKWLQQAAASVGVSVAGAQGVGQDASQVVNAGTPQHTQARQVGMEKLDKAFLELKAGNWPLARRFAEEAFHPSFGIQKEAADLLRSIDADEHNHRMNMASRNADAGIEAFMRRDYRRAGTLFTSVDLHLLHPAKAERIREIIATAEMQPGAVQQTVAKTGAQGVIPGETPGAGSATDVGQSVEDATSRFRALEEVQFQRLRELGLTAQKNAMDLFKQGQEPRAVDLLSEYLAQVAETQLDPEKMNLLKRPIENRLNQYRTIAAQKAMEKQASNIAMKHNEGDRVRKISKTQEEVARLMKTYASFQREGKFEEALAEARKAKELDPDNVAADAAILISTTAINQKRWDRNKAMNEKMFVGEMSNNLGPYVNMEGPVTFDKTVHDRAKLRDGGKNGFMSQTRTPTERAIERRLYEPISVNFRDMPLYQVIEDLHSMTGLNIVPERDALQEANISLDMPLSLSVEKLQLKSVLNLLLQQTKLTYVIRDEVLLITTPERGKGRLRTVTYPVADLVVPVNNSPTPSVYSMQDALARHIASSAGVVAQPVSPHTGPFSLPHGTAVSSQSSGNAGPFASASNPMAQSPLTQASRQNQTIEGLLMELIQNTVANNTWSNVGGQGTIQYFPLGMALVINQTQEVQEEVAALLAALRRLQELEVAIEMKLVSVSEAFFERVGLDFDLNIRTNNSRVEPLLTSSQFKPFGQINSIPSGIVSGLTPAGVLTPDLNIPVRATSFDFSIPPFGGFPGTLAGDGGLAVGLAFLSDIQVFMFMEAAQGDRRTNVMQAPKLTVFNGQTATLTVADQQFFLTSVSLIQANAQLFFSPNNQPFPLGVTLTVTPVVSADRRFVRINLVPALTNLASATVPLIPVQIPVPQLFEGPGSGNTTSGQPTIFQMFFQQPAFTTITLDTTVSVPDGGTVLLGGLKTMSEARNEFGPPILSKIPYLSRLFRNVGYGREGQSLMIMVTPRIIINEEEENIFLGILPAIPRP
ncbi:MAG: hypothetical protein L0Y72_26105 [Gemmataceae bacterium]|nr:hypothetical protein [Gemmataceae bacterium]